MNENSHSNEIMTIPLICRSCGFSRDVFKERADPPKTCYIISRCFNCGQKEGHTKVLIEYLDEQKNLISAV